MSKPEEKLLNEKEEVVNETVVDNEEKVEEIFTIGETNEENKIEISDDPSKMETIIEGERAKLKDFYKKSKRFSNISVLVAVALIIACFIMVSQNIDGVKIAGYCLGGVALVGMLVYYVLTKNKFPNATKEYINVVQTCYNGYAFHNEKYEDIYADKNEKVEKGDIAADMIYKDISRLASRNVVHARFDKQNLLVSDLAVYHKGPKNQDLPVFVGKYFSIENNVAFDGRIIIQIKNVEKEVDTPDYIEDLNLIKNEENYVLYASKGVDYKEVLGTKLVSTLKNIKVEGHLLNINIVIWGGHTAGYLSFDDATMVFPFENEYKAEPYVVYESVQLNILNALKVLNKHKEVKALKVEEPVEEVKEEKTEEVTVTEE